jgi:sugar O-acyltransferase (sialic acid O-acetyltransferase NeuD family)
MKNILIIGSGGHARVIASEIILQRKFKLLGFIDEKKKKNEFVFKYKNKKFYILGNIKSLKSKRFYKIYAIIGVGLNSKRKKILEEVKKVNKNLIWKKIISKNSILNNSKVGEGSFIGSGVIINNESKIGSHCIVNTGAIIEHNNILKDYASIGPGAMTGGNVIIDKFSFVGLGSIINNDIRIGSHVVVGSNSLITKICKSNCVYYGQPAKLIKKIKNDKIYF